MSVHLTNYSQENKRLHAIFSPEEGMTLLSYTLNDIECIAQSTREEFLKRRSGLGPLIGPHFHTHTSHIFPSSVDESLFPSVAISKKLGRKDPFSHGIARYAPWKYTASETQIQGILRGDDIWNGVALKTLEGQDFEIHFEARLLSSGLFIKYSITSEQPSLLGLHYYLSLPEKKGNLHTHVHEGYNDQGKIISPLPKEWKTGSDLLTLSIEAPIDLGFYPMLHEREYKAVLQTREWDVVLHFLTPNEKEVLLQVYHPKNADFCCVEPLTAREPRSPSLNHSTLECKITIIPHEKY